MEYYLLFIWNDVEPKLFGPYEDIKSRDKKAKKLRNDFGTTCGYFPMEVTKGSTIEIDSYSGAFFEE